MWVAAKGMSKGKSRADIELWIRKHREKTDELSSIPLLEIPRQIIEKYSDHKKIIGEDGMRKCRGSIPICSPTVDVSSFFVMGYYIW